MQTRHSNKTYALSLWGVGLALLMPSISHAFTSFSISTQTAIATTSGTGSVAMAVSIRRRSDNGAESPQQINWAPVAIPAGFVVASSYIQLDSTNTAATGGIEIYTDNTGPGANPAYSGVISSTTQTPAGLVNTVVHSQKLPTAWRISDTVLPSTAVAAANPNAGNADPNSFLWLYHEDKAQVAVPSQNAATFNHGDAFVTVENLSCPEGGSSLPCIHFAQSNTEFGGAASPNYIYTEADFSNALAGSTYQTSTLRLEAFTQ